MMNDEMVVAKKAEEKKEEKITSVLMPECC